MRIRLGLLVLLALAARPAYTQPDYLASQALLEAGLVKFWQFQLPLEKGQQLRELYLVEDQLYCGTQDGYAFAVHAPTGVLRWLRPITGAGYSLRRPCHAGDNVIFATPVDVQVYDRRTGDPVARHELRFPVGTAAVTDGHFIFLGGVDRRLYAFNPETFYLEWRTTLDGPVTANLALHGERIYVASDTGTVYGCTTENKTLVWQASVYDRVSADIVATDDGVFVASRDFSLYLFDLNYGAIRWRVRLAGPLFEAPVVTQDTVYQYSPAEGLVAINATTVGVVDERVRWKLPSGRAALTVHDNRVFVLTKDEKLAAIDVNDGHVASSVPAPGMTLGAPAPASATVFLASGDGRVFCARARGVPALRAEDLLGAFRSPTARDERFAATQPTARPAGAVADPLATKRRGAPMGGKSKISRGFVGESD